MKKRLFALVYILSISAAYSQGVRFEPSVRAAFEKAKKNNRKVMIELYHPDCGTCKAVDSTMKLPSMGNYYNQFYFSAKINVVDSNQMKYLINKKILVYTFPVVYYFDQNENLLHFEEGNVNTDKMIEYGQTARLGFGSNKSYLDKYHEGNREVSTLIAVAKQTKVSMDTLTNRKATKELFELYPKDNLNSQESWSIVARCITDIRSGFAAHWLQNLELAEQQAKKDGQPGMAKKILGSFVQSRLFGPESKKFVIEDVQYLESCLSSLGVTNTLQDNLWQAYVYASENDKTPTIGKTMLEKISAKNGNKAPALLYIGRFIIEETSSEMFLEDAKLALYNANLYIPKNDFKSLTEYNYLYAKLAVREKNPPVAKKYANDAVKNAKLAKLSLKPFLDLQASIKSD